MRLRYFLVRLLSILTLNLDGPIFYDYFYDQNQAIKNGSAKGVELNFNTLGVSLEIENL